MTRRITFVLLLSAAAVGCGEAEPPTGPSSLRSSATTMIEQANGNSAAAHLCYKDGYKSLVRADGTGFRNVGDCVSYAARGGTFPGSGGRVINTDTSWLATNIAPAPEWNTNPSFNTAGWTNAVVSTVTPAPCFNGADCIWYDDQQSATQFAWLRKTFTLSGTPTTAWLTGGVDDDADIYVNGTLVYGVHDGLAGSFGPIDVAPYLVQGVNLIAVSASDNIGFGLNHLFVAQLQIDTATATAVPKQGSLVLVAPGLAALALLRRKRERKAATAGRG